MDELIRAGLVSRQKTLPPSLLYDELGSALFEAITLLPEYAVARVDMALLRKHVAEALGLLGSPLELIELGPGHGHKARVVAAALLRRQSAAHFIGIDVSVAALAACARHLDDLSGLAFTGLEATFSLGLARLPQRTPRHKRLLLFLGSNLSNFDRGEAVNFLRQVRGALEPGDALLMSADLEKPVERLLPAYDDALGVTAAFSRNALVRLNREYGADFELSNFFYEAKWNVESRRVEAHLRARTACAVKLKKLELEVRFAAGESVRTETSHRFNLGELRAWGVESGMRWKEGWVDEQWPLALGLFVAG